jgi:class 3 adenylate cyclase
MALYLDRHDVPGATAEDLASAHAADIGVQQNHDVRYLTYWFDANAATVFCLAEGPSRNAVEAVHREAHGLLASTILEVEPGPVGDFLGAFPMHPVGTPYVASAVRTVLFTDICGSTAFTQRLGDRASTELVREHDRIIRQHLDAYAGREIKHTGDGIMAAFDTPSAAVESAVQMQQALAERNRRASTAVDVRIGISAGEPLVDGDDLFGATVQLAARLCGIGTPGGVTTSVAVRELCIGKLIHFEERDPVRLAGFPDTIRCFDVACGRHDERG